jgi:peptidoglycan/LPS O-acetylase OafA/YrhL
MWRGGYTGQAFLSFMGRRLARLYPPYAISVCIMAVTALVFGANTSFGALVAHAFYLNDLLGLPWLTEVYWTLAVEVQFYVVIALVWRVVAVGRSWPFVALGLATALATMLPWADRSLPNYGSYFLLGIAAFRWHGEIGSRSRQRRSRRPCGSSPSDVKTASHQPVLHCSRSRCWHCRSRVPRWSRFLGDISYSLYLFHLMTGTTFLVALESFPLSPGSAPPWSLWPWLFPSAQPRLLSAGSNRQQCDGRNASLTVPARPGQSASDWRSGAASRALINASLKA